MRTVRLGQYKDSLAICLEDLVVLEPVKLSLGGKDLGAAGRSGKSGLEGRLLVRRRGWSRRVLLRVWVLPDELEGLEGRYGD